MQTIQEIISRVDEIKINPYSEAAKVNWINQVEGWIKDKIIQNYEYFEICRVKDQAAYDIPAGISFKNITIAYINMTYPMQKLDARSPNKAGYFLDSAGKLNICPIPGQDDPAGSPGLRFVYKVQHVPYKYPADKDTDLLIAAPYDKIYEDYIYAMIDWSNREYGAYENGMSMYNASWREVERSHTQLIPVSTAQIRNTW